MNNKLIHVGVISNMITKYTAIPAGKTIYKSTGLKKHIVKRHPDCVKYIHLIPDIIRQPDYIGINPNESGLSFELIKTFDENIQIGIKLDIQADYFYVSTLHTITNSKVTRRVASGRLQKTV